MLRKRAIILAPRSNWRPPGSDERAPLERGDVIGVGRSLLVSRRT